MFSLGGGCRAGQYNHCHVITANEVSQNLDAVDVRKAKVEEDEIDWLRCDKKAHERPVIEMAQDMVARVGSEEKAQTEARDRVAADNQHTRAIERSEEHTSELQSLMRISYAVFCLKKKNTH